MLKSPLVFLLITLSASCTLMNRKAPPNGALQAFHKLADLEKTTLVLQEGVRLPDDSIQLPDDVSRLLLRPFLESYAELHRLQIIQRNEQIVVADPKNFAKLWVRDPEQAMALSKAQNKPIFVKVTNDWCHICRIQTKLFYKEEKLFQELNNYILLEVDSDHILAAADAKSIQTAAFLKARNIRYDRAPELAVIYGDTVKVFDDNSISRNDDWSEYWGELLLFRKSLGG